MTTDNIIDLLIIACGGLLVWSIAVTLTLWHERREREPKATASSSLADCSALTTNCIRM